LILYSLSHSFTRGLAIYLTLAASKRHAGNAPLEGSLSPRYYRLNEIFAMLEAR
jgi:hypothetical protein